MVSVIMLMKTGFPLPLIGLHIGRNVDQTDFLVEDVYIVIVWRVYIVGYC